MTKRKKIFLILLSPVILVVFLALSIILYLFFHYDGFFTIPPEIVLREEVVPLPRTKGEDRWAIELHRQMREKFGIEEEELPEVALCESWRRWRRMDMLRIRSDSLSLLVDRTRDEVIGLTDRTLPPAEERDATRSQEEVISLAEDYIRKITGRARPADYNALSVRYDREEGWWLINYIRTVDGIMFCGAHGFFFLSIDDLSGRLRTFAKGVPLERLPPLDVRITRERAIRIARGGIFLIGRVMYPDLVYAELKIVNPNLSMTLTGFHAEERVCIGEVYPYKPRLVWVIAFASCPCPKFGQRVFIRWVDAQTGRIVGGIFRGPMRMVERYKNIIHLD